MSDNQAGKRSDQVAAELEAARSEHRAWVERFGDYDGNNPNKFRTQIRNAAQEVRRLEGLLHYLQERGE
ncbi:hypothetical protein JMJ55_28480 [Belnapia sp. T6]|uniref:Uncharacterized protein n=1 Tax=Belnapia mucosa TaxID=2804532 RepID=A0ABS1VFR5_9PROT|nr:hypothetical protein [Belnapia mucosa]MBL6459263.1 hypothetical protein [Belnapia mucosa]